MIPLVDLWLPILLSAVLVFVASSIFHMVIPIHKGDFGKLPNEDKVLEAMRAAGVQPGSYMFPCAGSMKEMCTPEMVAKQKLGPVGHVTLLPNGPFNMGKNLTQWFLLCLAIGLFTAYATSLAHGRGTAYPQVFRMAATVAFLGYGISSVTDSIWKGVSWKTTAKFVFDGIVYALVTAGTFGWLWPK